MNSLHSFNELLFGPPVVVETSQGSEVLQNGMRSPFKNVVETMWTNLRLVEMSVNTASSVFIKGVRGSVRRGARYRLKCSQNVATATPMSRGIQVGSSGLTADLGVVALELLDVTGASEVAFPSMVALLGGMVVEIICATICKNTKGHPLRYFARPPVIKCVSQFSL